MSNGKALDLSAPPANTLPRFPPHCILDSYLVFTQQHHTKRGRLTLEELVGELLTHTTSTSGIHGRLGKCKKQSRTAMAVRGCSEQPNVLVSKLCFRKTLAISFAFLSLIRGNIVF